jgi:hypothetical protein
MEQLGSNLTDFHEFRYLSIFRKCKEISGYIKILQEKRYCTSRPMYTYDNSISLFFFTMRNVSGKSQNTQFMLGFEPSESSPKHLSFRAPNIKFPQNPLHSFRDETYGQIDRQAEITCSWSVHCTRFEPRRQNINITAISILVKTKAYRMWTLCIFLWCESSKRCARLAGLLWTGIRIT